MKLANIYPQRGLEIVRGEGRFVYDRDNNQYLDFMQGHGVGILGHNNAEWIKAVDQQMREITICTPSLQNSTRDKLVERLGEILPDELNSVFLCNSGTESVEAAIKLARKHTGKSKVIAMKKGFHGRTLGSLALTWKPTYRKGFEPFSETVHVRFNDIENLRENIDDKVAAIIIEPIQGEGGLDVADKSYLEEVRRICLERDILLIFDEVQTFLRTGRYFAFEHFDVVPDILCISKGLGNGFPIGAMIARENIMDSFGMLGHGSTFGGNPLACSAALATLNIIRNQNLIQNSEETATYFRQRLQEEFGNNEKVRDFVGLGLMLGIDLKEKVTPYIKSAMEQNFLVLPAGLTVLRMLPPINLTKEEVDLAIDKLREVFANV